MNKYTVDNLLVRYEQLRVEWEHCVADLATATEMHNAALAREHAAYHAMMEEQKKALS